MARSKAYEQAAALIDRDKLYSPAEAVTLAKNFKSYGGERFTVDPTVQARGAAQVVRVTINSDTLLYQMQRDAKEK